MAGPLLGLLLALKLQGRRAPAPTGAYGTARWATSKELSRAGLLGERGIILGQLAEAEFRQGSDARWRMTKASRLLRYDGDGHNFVCARTRAGKGVTSVVPTLLSYTKGSVLVHDPKGENWELTAGWRSRFSHCLRFDPTAEHSVRFNPLLEVRPPPLDVRDAQNIAEILVNPESMTDEQRDHWKLTGHAFLVGVILHVLYSEPDKSVAGVLRVLTDPERPFNELVEAMLHTRHLPSGPHPTVAGAARAMQDRAENERAGVKSTATSFLEIYRDPLMAANTSTSDFTIADLMCAKSPVSLYFVVPTSDIERTRPVVRLLLNVIGRRLTEHLGHVDGGPGMAPPAASAWASEAVAALYRVRQWLRQILRP
ncbi:MAG TPA: type IV secretory system conjugative DNA transfer family protein, partial [Polyangiaceae bacterium]